MVNSAWKRSCRIPLRWLAWACAGWILGGGTVGGIVAWAQMESGGRMSAMGDTPVEFVYESYEISNFGQPNERHWVSGSPAVVTAFLKDSTLVVEAPFLSYASQAGVVSATRGIVVSNGTLTVRARQGTFNMAEKRGRFVEDVRWRYGQGSNWGTCDKLTFDIGESGQISRIKSESDKKPGRMNLHSNRGAPFPGRQDVEPGAVDSSPSAVPPIERVLSPLEQ